MMTTCTIFCTDEHSRQAMAIPRRGFGFFLTAFNQRPFHDASTFLKDSLGRTLLFMRQ